MNIVMCSSLLDDVYHFFWHCELTLCLSHFTSLVLIFIIHVISLSLEVCTWNFIICIKHFHCWKESRVNSIPGNDNTTKVKKTYLGRWAREGQNLVLSFPQLCKKPRLWEPVLFWCTSSTFLEIMQWYKRER